MKIPYHYSLEVAHQIVDKINIPKEVGNYVTLESWSNCREQGLCISVALGKIKQWKKICVAQQRSSDSILIIAGNSMEFDNNNQPSEEIWPSRITFSYNEQNKAAKYIKDQIMEFSGLVK